MPAARPDDPADSASGRPNVPWHDTPAAMAVAGVGGVVAIGALVFAILMTSQQSGAPVPSGPLTTAVTTTKPSSRAVTTSSSTPPRTPVSTSEDLGTSSAPAPLPSQEEPAETSVPPTTTMSNPYVTTTAPRAGAV